MAQFARHSFQFLFLKSLDPGILVIYFSRLTHATSAKLAEPNFESTSSQPEEDQRSQIRRPFSNYSANLTLPTPTRPTQLTHLPWLQPIHTHLDRSAHLLGSNHFNRPNWIRLTWNGPLESAPFHLRTSHRSPWIGQLTSSHWECPTRLGPHGSASLDRPL